MNRVFRNGLEGRNFKEVLQFYLTGLIVIMPVLIFIGVKVGIKESFQYTPLAAAIFIYCAYAIPHLSTWWERWRALRIEWKVRRWKRNIHRLIPVNSNASTISATYLKRAFDVIVTSLLLLGLAPLLLLLALLIKICSPQGPVFFAQTRVGYNGRQFKMLKFRTMVPYAEGFQLFLEHLHEAPGPMFKMQNDPRITPIGRILRKTSLDELPQLFNVIKGDMSLVGPRPLPLRDVERFEEAWLRRRFSVKPGMTCLWQVSEHSNATFDTWIAQDLAYIDNWSFHLDLEILCKTVPAVVRGLGAVSLGDLRAVLAGNADST